ncbi:MAG: lactate racemase domain-containing protein [Bacillota bacterium]|jgi:hypothetical protein
MDFTPVRVKQDFPKGRVDDVKSLAAGALWATDFPTKIKKGMKVAVLAGSRGIMNIKLIVRTVVDEIKKAGGEPSVVAAMGSHGGGTAEGQREVLCHLGISEETMDCPIVCSGESVLIGTTLEGYPVYVSCPVLQFDGIIAINRIKPHTAFKGEIESGLLKMLSVGLGGPAGAASVHAQGAKGLRLMVPSIGREVKKRLPFWGGLAIVENAYEQTYQITGVGNTALEETEKKLLVLAKQLMPSLPFPEIDVLVVEEMGKNFSGTGMDSNVINRMRIHGEPEPEGLAIKRIVVLDLADASQGNATGIGLADFTTKTLVQKIDYQATYLNCLTSTFVQRAMIPVIMEDEEQAIKAAIKSLGNVPAKEARLVRIANTLSLDFLQVSKSLIPEVHAHPRLEIIE